MKTTEQLLKDNRDLLNKSYEILSRLGTMIIESSSYRRKASESFIGKLNELNELREGVKNA